MPHGAVRAWTVTYVVRGLALKPRYARRRPQTLKMQLGSARPAAQHVHRSRGATRASPSRRCGASRWLEIGGAQPCRAQQRPPRPLAPLRYGHVSLHMQKCAVVVLVQCCGNVCWSVHRGRARACARARVCACAVQGLPNAPTRAGNGPPVVELPDHRTRAGRSPRARGHPPWRAVHRSFFPPCYYTDKFIMTVTSL